jgi:hypothetical protein
VQTVLYLQNGAATTTVAAPTKSGVLAAFCRRPSPLRNPGVPHPNCSPAGPIRPLSPRLPRLPLSRLPRPLSLWSRLPYLRCPLLRSLLSLSSFLAVVSDGSQGSAWLQIEAAVKDHDPGVADRGHQRSELDTVGEGTRRAESRHRRAASGAAEAPATTSATEAPTSKGHLQPPPSPRG